MQVPTTSSLGLSNLLEWLTDDMETLTFTSLLKDVIKETNQQPEKENTQGEVANKGASSSWSLRPSSEGFWFPKQGSSQEKNQKLSSWVFMKASLHKRD